MSQTTNAEIAKAIASRLFINGQGDVGKQLRLMDAMPLADGERGPTPVYLGGWSRSTVEAQIEMVLVSMRIDPWPEDEEGGR